jgi:broad specificity phosphatase PhoE
MAIAALVSSPLARARQTADIIAARIDVAVLDDPDLAEYDVGAVSGLTGAQIQERYPEVAAAWERGVRPTFPEEEGRNVFHARVARALARLTEHGEGTVVAVAHGGIVAAICQHVTGIDHAKRSAFEVRNCSLTEVTRDRLGRLVLIRQNDVCHLAGVR